MTLLVVGYALLAVIIMVAAAMQGDATANNTKRVDECTDAVNQYAHHVADHGGKILALEAAVLKLTASHDKLAENFSIPSGLLPAPLPHSEDDVTPVAIAKRDDEPTLVTKKKRGRK